MGLASGMDGPGCGRKSIGRTIFDHKRLVGVLEFGELVAANAVFFGSSHAFLPRAGLTIPAGPSGRNGKGGGVAKPRRGDNSPHSRRAV